MSQMSVTPAIAQELLDQIVDPQPWVMNEHYLCKTCQRSWSIAGISEPGPDGADHDGSPHDPGDWHREEGHDVVIEEVMSPEHTVDLARIENAARLVEVANDLLREVVSEVRSVEDKTRKVTMTEAGSEWPLFDLEARKPNDKSRARYGWDVIARVLRVSPQAAQQRFTPRSR